MNSKLFLVLSLILGSAALGQQRQAAVSFRHTAVSQRLVESTRSLSAADTLRVLAIMVDFQTDEDERTSGNGKFQLQTNLTGLIDPPPHDSVFFSYKLRFVENYFRKVSNGQLTIQGDILGRVITLSKAMASYAPPSNSSTIRGLADLAIESWLAADSVMSNIPFSQYDAFVIFHAGAGHDIDLVGVFGFDPTPNDIPSLYLSLNSFREALQDPTFAGIQTRGGFHITNTIILPETETRVFVSSGRTDTLKLSINGLVAASFGSHLGLPDLFDTKTGRQGIGQFGLMDGAAIFAYSGLFPPEPSAWEKTSLGWVTPITVNSSVQNIPIPAASLTTAGQDTIYKIPITTSEYFLVENRNRDPQRNGQRLTIFERGAVRTQTFARDTIVFSFNSVIGITGSVFDVEDFDWALLGFIDGSEMFDGGGVLIWHIDESVIQRGLATNTVNADPNKRGVDLEEADGAQDIGQVYDLLDPGAASTSGSPLDCWFDGNSATTYKNVFNKNSFPNSNSNSGARSLVTIKDFSKRDPRMTFSIQVGDELAKPLTGFPKNLGGNVFEPIGADLNGDGKVEILALQKTTGKGSVHAWMLDGSPFYPLGDSLGIVAEVDSPWVDNLLVLKHPSTNVAYIAAYSDGIYLWKVEDLDTDDRFDRVFKYPVQASPSFGRRALFVDTLLVAFTSMRSRVVALTLEGLIQSQFDISSSGGIDICRIGATDQIAVTISDSIYVLNVRTGQLIRKMWLSGGGVRDGIEGNARSVVSGDVLGNGGTQIVVLANQFPGGDEAYKRVYVFDDQGNSVLETEILNRYTGRAESVFGGPILADVDGDGRKDITAISALGQIFAINGKGYLLDGFPRHSEVVPPASALPVVGDITNDGKPEILFVDSRGVLRIYDARNPLVHHESIQTGASASNFISGFSFGNVSMFPVSTQAPPTVGILSVDDQGRVYALDFQTPYNPSNILWPMYRYDQMKSSFGSVQTNNPAPLSDLFFPRERVYNWPNPVYGTTTQIRYYVLEDANVSIKIFDLVGAKIAELNGKAAAGIDSEVTWDVSTIQSGIYLARVEAVGASRSDVAIIKIAVVK